MLNPLKWIRKALRRKRVERRQAEAKVNTRQWAKTGPLHSHVKGGGGCLWPLTIPGDYK